MKINQKIINTIILALLGALVFFQYQQNHQPRPEIVYAKQAPSPSEEVVAPELVPFVSDENTADSWYEDNEVTWYCWLSYWVPTKQKPGAGVPADGTVKSYYYHPNRFQLVQKNRPTAEDFTGVNGLFVPFQIREIEGIDLNEVELANIYAIKVAKPFK